MNNKTNIARALILSGSIGSGHDSSAAACREALEACGVRTESVDCMKLLGGVGSRLGTQVFKSVLSVPPIYDALHFSQIKQGTRLARSMSRQGSSRIARRLAEQIDGSEDGGAGILLVSVFPLGSQVIGLLKHELPQAKAVTLCTDWSSHSMWVGPGVDLYLVGSALAESTTLRYCPNAVTRLLPIPVRRRFYSAPDRSKAREILGISDADDHVVLATGAWASKKAVAIAGQLATDGFVVSALAGMNRSLFRALREASTVRWSGTGEIRAYGFIEDVEVHMAACDAVITTPGIASCEARTIGRRQLILDIVPGHGRENAIAELCKGAALVSGPDPRMVSGLTRRLISSLAEPVPERFQDWQAEFLRAIGDL